ncbi:MAG TPA: lytic transglycosylase domain-containing protein [Stellaceae bacterium]|nr:lytic transglycosylase domain-containing protein [Stellaceae bacterium]
MPTALTAALLGLCVACPAPALSAHAAPNAPVSAVGTVAGTTCSLVEAAARADDVPVGLLTRLIWQESRFRADAISPKGAQGIAQFMPETSANRGLSDPFDPEMAIPKAAALLADLTRRFGNVGLAAAAYNAGTARVAAWLDGSAGLPTETQSYVLAVTGRAVEDWAADRKAANSTAAPETCLAVTAELRAGESVDDIPLAPWGVQLSGNFSKQIALASFERAKARYPGLLGEVRPMILGSVLRSRGTRRFYRVFVPAETRAEADHICRTIVADGGACVALRT